jgi:hypothetical protein
MFTNELQCPPQNGIRQCERRRILCNSFNCATTPRIVQRRYEIAVANMEHRQHSEEPNLVEGIAVRLCDRQSPGHRCASGIAWPEHLQQGDAEAGLKVHLVVAAKGTAIERPNRSHRPKLGLTEEG